MILVVNRAGADRDYRYLEDSELPLVELYSFKSYKVSSHEIAVGTQGYVAFASKIVDVSSNRDWPRSQTGITAEAYAVTCNSGPSAHDILDIVPIWLSDNVKYIGFTIYSNSTRKTRAVRYVQVNVQEKKTYSEFR